MLPIFSTHYSLGGKSILTCDEAKDIDVSSPISIFSIAKKYQLQEVHLREKTMTGFIEAFENSEKAEIQLCFGLQLTVCENVEKKDADSYLTESNITLWARNSAAYKDLVRISSDANTKFVHGKPRIDWKYLNANITPNLGVSVPFYSSFIIRNALWGHKCVDDFGAIDAVLEVSEMGLPFDAIIKEKVLEYATDNRLRTENVHLIYYYDKASALALQTFRCICQKKSYGKRATLENPNLEHFCSNLFCWEAFCEKEGISL